NGGGVRYNGDGGRTTYNNDFARLTGGEILSERTPSWQELSERDPRYNDLLPSPEEILLQEQKLQQELSQYKNRQSRVQSALLNFNEFIVEQTEKDQFLLQQLYQSPRLNNKLSNDAEKKTEEKNEFSREQQYLLNTLFTICKHINAEYTIKSWPKNKRYCAILRVPILKRSFGGFKSTKELALEMVAEMAIEEFSRKMPEVAYAALEMEGAPGADASKRLIRKYLMNISNKRMKCGGHVNVSTEYETGQSIYNTKGLLTEFEKGDRAEDSLFRNEDDEMIENDNAGECDIIVNGKVVGESYGTGYVAIGGNESSENEDGEDGMNLQSDYDDSIERNKSLPGSMEKYSITVLA
ncbi:10355_t:CDS:2, partial [Acaulospora colombiana]